jgi:hypothetical protein
MHTKQLTESFFVALYPDLRKAFWNFFSLALQPSFRPWPTSMKLSVSLRFIIIIIIIICGVGLSP